MERKMNTVHVVGLIIFTVAVMLACQRDSQDLLNTKVQQSSQAAQENSAMIASTQDVVSTTAGAAVSQGLAFGRFTDNSSDDGSDDDECKPTITNTIKVDRTNPDSVIISGKIVIDFGTGATCADSAVMKKGKIIDSIYVVLSKKSHVASEFITFQNYWRDSTQMDGSISITSATGSPTVIKVDGTKVRYRDGTSTSWKGDLTFTIQASGIGNSYTASMTVTGSWSGVTRKGEAFTANISKDVIFKAGCFGHRHKFTPVSGTIDVVAAGVSSSIDYGDGTCDRTYTVTTAGKTTEHHLG